MPGIELVNGAGSLAQPRHTHFSDPLPVHALASMNVTENMPHVNNNINININVNIT